MSQIEFGELLASLRKEHVDFDTRPWTQGRLAVEVNEIAGAKVVNEDIISNIERGKRQVDANLLHLLATALQLTSGEKREFFLVASGITFSKNSDTKRHELSQQIFAQLLQKVPDVHLPAFIIDSYCDVLAANGAVLQLLDLEAAGMTLADMLTIPCGLNMLQFVFANKAEAFYKPLMQGHWDNYAYQNMMMFKTYSLRYRAKPHFNEILQALSHYSWFRMYWREAYHIEKTHLHNNEHIYLHTPEWGELTYYSANFQTITPCGTLYFCTYNPLTANTADLFTKFVEQAGSMMVPTQDWPSTSL